MTLLAIPPTSGKKHVPTEEGKGFGVWKKNMSSIQGQGGSKEQIEQIMICGCQDISFGPNNPFSLSQSNSSLDTVCCSLKKYSLYASTNIFP